MQLRQAQQIGCFNNNLYDEKFKSVNSSIDDVFHFIYIDSHSRSYSCYCLKIVNAILSQPLIELYWKRHAEHMLWLILILCAEKYGSTWIIFENNYFIFSFYTTLKHTIACINQK